MGEEVEAQVDIVCVGRRLAEIGDSGLYRNTSHPPVLVRAGKVRKALINFLQAFGSGLEGGAGRGRGSQSWCWIPDIKHSSIVRHSGEAAGGWQSGFGSTTIARSKRPQE